MGMGSRPTTMMPIYSGSPQGGFGQQYGTGTYDPMLGFGQASGMGTTYNYPTRYSADYTRYAQSGQQFNQPVMGYNSYGQIFAQPRRQPPPTMGGKGGGFQQRRPPAPTLGSKGGGFQQSRSLGPYTGGFGNNEPGRRFTGGFGNSVASPPSGGFGNNVPEPAPQELLSPLVPIRKPLDQERILPDQNIANSPFAALLGSTGQNAYNPAFQQQQELLARQQQISDRAPPGMMRNPNYNAARAMQDDMPRGQEDYLSRQPFIPIGGGLGGMPSGTQVTNPNQFAVSTADLRYDPTTGTTGPSVTRYFENPVSGNFSSDLFGGLGGRFGAMQFQEGGQVPPDAASNMDMMLSEAGPANPQSEMAGEYDRLIQMTMQAVLGQTENADEIIQMFIDEFGADAFRQLRDAVLKQQVPGAQTEGMVDGNGGGMDDQVMGMIGNQRPVAVSPGEYIVPADVVSGLGDGSSKSGADILDELNQAVRMARTGTTEQPRPLAESMR